MASDISEIEIAAITSALSRLKIEKANPNGTVYVDRETNLGYMRDIRIDIQNEIFDNAELENIFRETVDPRTAALFIQSVEDEFPKAEKNDFRTCETIQEYIRDIEMPDVSSAVSIFNTEKANPNGTVSVDRRTNSWYMSNVSINNENKMSVVNAELENVGIETADPTAEVLSVDDSLGIFQAEEIKFRMCNTIQECARDFVLPVIKRNLYMKYKVDVQKLFSIIDKTIVPFIQNRWLKPKEGVSAVVKVKAENVPRETVAPGAEYKKSDENNLISKTIKECAGDFIKHEIEKYLRLQYELVYKKSTFSIADKVTDPYIKEGWLKRKNEVVTILETKANGKDLVLFQK